MERRILGNTGLSMPLISLGASSLGHAFRPVGLDAALRCVREALDVGMDHFDTSPFYGCGNSSRPVSTPTASPRLAPSTHVRTLRCASLVATLTGVLLLAQSPVPDDAPRAQGPGLSAAVAIRDDRTDPPAEGP